MALSLKITYRAVRKISREAALEQKTLTAVPVNSDPLKRTPEDKARIIVKLSMQSICSTIACDRRRKSEEKGM